MGISRCGCADTLAPRPLQPSLAVRSADVSFDVAPQPPITPIDPRAGFFVLGKGLGLVLLVVIAYLLLKRR